MHLKQKLIYIITIVLLACNLHAQDTMPSKNYLMAKEYYAKGIHFGKNGIIDSALHYGKLSVKLFESLDQHDSIQLANAYQSLGIINKINGKYTDAIKYYNKAEEIYRLKNNEWLLAHIYSNMANIYNIQRDYQRAKEYLLHAYNIFKTDSLKNRILIANIYNNLGNYYKNLGNYNVAIEYYYKSLELKSDIKYTTYGNLATSYKNLHNYDLADKYYKKAIFTTLDKYGKENIISASRFFDYAIFLSLMNKDKEALSYLRDALETYTTNFGQKHPFIANTYRSIGNVYLKNKQLDSALFYYQNALISNSNNFVDTNICNNPELDDVISKIHILSSLKYKANALSLLAVSKKDIELFEASLATYDLAIDAINYIRSGYRNEESKLILTENQFETYTNALNTCYHLYELTKDPIYFSKAFNYSELSKSAVLTELLNDNYALNIGGVPDSLINKEKELEKSIWTYEELTYEEKKKQNPNPKNLEYWSRYLFEAKQEYDELNRFLETNYNKYYQLKHSKNYVDVNKLQKTLGFKDVIIEFSTTDTSIYTFVVGKFKNELLKTRIDDQFYVKLDSLILSLSNNNFSSHGMKEFNEFQQLSNYIYNSLINPVKDYIKRKNIIIIPSGKLAYLPFETLISNVEKYESLKYKDLPYLIKTNTISYSYSANFLINDTKTSRQTNNYLAAFAPTYNNIENIDSNLIATRQEYREKLFPLKGIKEEAEKISEITNGDSYIDFEANEKTFKKVSSKYDILHLAMHTIMDDNDPMYSKMAFTQNNDTTEDGFLNTYELYNLELNSRMAVLSSCNSGSGKLNKGEGVISLARGFFYAGCPSLVMTLWSVEDKSGVNLMVNFYTNLINGLNKSKSLQKSKLHFIDKSDQLHAHPYFWSGYVVIGNNDALFTRKFNYYLWGSVALALVMGIILFRKFSSKP